MVLPAPGGRGGETGLLLFGSAKVMGSREAEGGQHQQVHRAGSICLSSQGQGGTDAPTLRALWNPRSGLAGVKCGPFQTLRGSEESPCSADSGSKCEHFHSQKPVPDPTAPFKIPSGILATSRGCDRFESQIGR